ncbi:MAG: hypothetical protein GWN08_01415, partial [Gemmatimonadetes bacterium]|nr:hypothetical protein [Gemmatimonadota bacterium]
MRQPSQREYVMIGVLAVALLAWLYFGDRGIGRGSRTGVGRAQLPTGEAPIVHLDRLAALDEPFDPQGRDLFKYGPPPRTAPP